jgi:hypothetical protein
MIHQAESRAVPGHEVRQFIAKIGRRLIAIAQTIRKNSRQSVRLPSQIHKEKAQRGAMQPLESSDPAPPLFPLEIRNCFETPFQEPLNCSDDILDEDF